MARQIRRFGKLALLLGPLVVLAFLLVPTPQPAAAAYTTPYWTNTSVSPECICASACGCEGPPEWGPEGVSNRTGELRQVLPVFELPGKTRPFALSLLLRSDVSGSTQFGSHVIPSYLTTVELVEDIPGSRWAANGNHANVRDHTGVMSSFNWNGTAYVATSCLETRTLSLPSGTGGPYRLTDKHGAKIDFDSNGVGFQKTPSA